MPPLLRKLPPLPRPGPLVRRHLPFLLVFAAGAVLRALVSYAYRPVLLYKGDSDSYLHVAANQPTVPGPEYRPIGYPVFLHLFAGEYHPTATVAVQHLLGLATGLIIYLVAVRLRLPRWAATLAAAPALLDPYQIDLEHFVMSEALTTILLTLGVALLLVSRHAVATLLGGLSLATAGLVRSDAVAVSVLVGGYLLVDLLVRRAVWRTAAVRAVVGLLALGAPLLAYRAVHGRLLPNGPNLLYGRFAIIADCQRDQLTAEEQLLCDPRPMNQRPGPCWYGWYAGSPLQTLPVRDPRLRFAGQSLSHKFVHQVALHEPVRYLASTLLLFGRYFSPVRFTGWAGFDVANWQFPLHTTNAGVPVSPSIACGSYRTIAVNQPVASWLHDYQQVVFTPMPLVALALLVGLFRAVRSAWRRTRFRCAAFLLPALVGLLMLVVPSATVGFDWRFLVPALPLLSLAAMVGVSPNPPPLPDGATGKRGEQLARQPA